MAKTSAPPAVARVAMVLLLAGTSTKDAQLVAAPRHRPVRGTEAGVVAAGFAVGASMLS